MSIVIISQLPNRETSADEILVQFVGTFADDAEIALSIVEVASQWLNQYFPGFIGVVDRNELAAKAKADDSTPQIALVATARPTRFDVCSVSVDNIGWIRTVLLTKIETIGYFEAIPSECEMDLQQSYIQRLEQSDMRKAEELVAAGDRNESLRGDIFLLAVENDKLRDTIKDNDNVIASLSNQIAQLTAENNKNRNYMLEQEQNLNVVRKANIEHAKRARPVLDASPIDLLASHAAEIAGFDKSRLMTRAQRSEQLAVRRAKIDERKLRREEAKKQMALLNAFEGY